jgi:uncharacterized membrane protein YbhN (UPF0104 family)
VIARLRRLALDGMTPMISVVLMLMGSVALWVGVPVAWLWVGSRVQGETGSLGYALLAMMCGVALSIALIVRFLAVVSRRHEERRAARGDAEQRATALEQVLVASGALALLVFATWFFGFSGSEPFPLEIAY